MVTLKKAAMAVIALAALNMALMLPGCDGNGADGSSAGQPAAREAGRVVFIGLDGASWNVIMPLVNAGRMPNMRKLMLAGAWGELESEKPTLSPVIWTTQATGVGREEHGIDDFAVKVPGEYDAVFMTSDFRKRPALWNIFSAYGKSVGAVNWWATWPAEKVNGFNVSNYLFFIHALELIDGEAPDMEGMVYPDTLAGDVGRWRKTDPAQLKAELKEVFGSDRMVTGFTGRGAEGGMDPTSPEFQMGLRKYECQRVLEIELGETRVGAELYSRYRPDLFMFYLEGIDLASHFWWDYYEPISLSGMYDVSREDQERYGEVLPDYYEFTDRRIGEILDAVGEDATIIVTSDHGFKAKPPYEFGNIFELNRLFEILGYLRYEEDGERIDYAGTKLIDFNRSDFWGPHRKLYVNLKDREKSGVIEPGEEYDRFMDEITRVLGSIKTVKGMKLFSDLTRPEPGASDGLRQEPDLIALVNLKIEQDDAIVVDGREYPVSEFLVRRPISGTHETNGILVISGPDIPDGKVIKGASIYDIAPTVLYMGGLPVARYMRGGVLTDAFEKSYVRENPVVYVEDYDITGRGGTETGPRKSAVDSDVKQRLKSLGYIQ